MKEINGKKIGLFRNLKESKIKRSPLRGYGWLFFFLFKPKISAHRRAACKHSFREMMFRNLDFDIVLNVSHLPLRNLID